MTNASANFAAPPHTAAAVPTALPASIAMDTAAINASGVALPLPEADAPTVHRECTRSRRTPLLFCSVEHVGCMQTDEPVIVLITVSSRLLSILLKSKRSRRPYGQVTV